MSSINPRWGNSSYPVSHAWNTSTQNQLFWTLFVMILGVAIVLRLWNIGEANLWTDEVYSEFRATAPLDEALESMWDSGNQNPLFFLILRVLPSNDEGVLRLPSVFFGVMGVGLLMLVAQHLYRNQSLTLWIGVILASSPFHVMISRTARPYAMLFVLCLLSSWYFLRLLRGERSLRLWLMYILSTMLAYFTHYSAGALGLTAFFVLALTHRTDRQFLMRWVGAQIIAALPFIIWVITLLLHFETTYAGGFVAPTLLTVPVSFWNLIIGYDGTFVLYVLPALLVITVGYFVGWAFAIHERRFERENLYWFLLIVVSVLPVVIISILVSPAYQDRYFTVMLPGLMLLLMLGLRRLPESLHTAALVIILATATYNILGLFENGDYRRSDWESATEYIEANNQPGDSMLFEEDIEFMAFEHYFDEGSQVLQNHLFLEETRDTSSFEASAERIWVIYRNPNEDFHRQGAMPDFTPFEATVSLMDNWLRENYQRILSIREFQGVTVVLVDGPTKD